MFRYIDGFYNTERIQKDLGWLSPTSTKPPGTPPRPSQLPSRQHRPQPGNNRLGLSGGSSPLVELIQARS
ncbi:hypothetical protein [Saccharothrix sp. ALI-22-I]|uniref:hypothetical protein n=1 Tax=Saccharothrix sp. ALI-22-I TaxID=1933778 RepID=UPI0030827B16